MGKKHRNQRKQAKSERNYMKVVYVFLFGLVLCAIIGAVSMFLRDFVYPDMYYVLLVEWIAIISLYVGAFILCAFFLYMFSVIVFINPQRIKRKRVVKFAVAGILFTIFTIFIVPFGTKEMMKGSHTLQEFKDGNWIVEDVIIKHVNGPDMFSNLTLLETDVGVMVLHWKPFQIYQNQPYRIKYLEKSLVVLEIQPIRNE